MRRSLAGLVGLVCLVCQAALANGFVTQHIPDAQVVGEGRLSYYFWKVYDATLYAPDGEWGYDRPYALSLRYFLDIEGRKIADSSLEEMRKQGSIDEAQLLRWHAQMMTIFPDVREGSVLSVIYAPGRGCEFFEGKTSLGVIGGDSFARSFIDIWLGEDTSEPGLRRKLLGFS